GAALGSTSTDRVTDHTTRVPFPRAEPNRNPENQPPQRSQELEDRPHTPTTNSRTRPPPTVTRLPRTISTASTRRVCAHDTDRQMHGLAWPVAPAVVAMRASASASVRRQSGRRDLAAWLVRRSAASEIPAAEPEAAPRRPFHQHAACGARWR